ncbi:chymotrypsin-2 isoform X1 [Solenopsis invicta]|uniref:chymotrypsin-2 isoform X1 n=1 Tax=Solenopsis invicta TaxID=13686 RepID=UPI00193CC488|nr:chymotrypsin-2 isoform X1 [Solenopsis invicta]
MTSKQASVTHHIMALRVLYFLSLLAFSYAGILPFLNPRIVNGREAEEGEIPYQVSLQDKNNFGRHFCGGSILDENYVITAAHCVDIKQEEDLKVVAGTIDLDSPKSSHDVERIIKHKEYNPKDSWKNDIALLKVTPPFKESATIKRVTLRSTNVETNDPAVVSGWGKLWQTGPSTNKLRLVDIFIADQTTCENRYRDRFGMTVHQDEQVCAYNPSSEKGSCQGDSGGPLTVNNELVGLVSWAYLCADQTYPTVFTRVFHYLNWIDEQRGL